MSLLATGYGKTDIGLKRPNNEDYFKLDDDMQFYIVCDGVGGNNAGEVASCLACEAVYMYLEAHLEVLQQFLEGHRKMKNIYNLLHDAVQTANSAVLSTAAENVEYEDMATTLTLLLILDNKAFYAHVGDSRLYIVRDDELHCITEDHTLANELKLSAPEEEHDLLEQTYGNVLCRAIGIEEPIEVDVSAFDIERYDRFLLCSDGLSSYINDQELEKVILTHDSEIAVDQLIYGSHKGGGKDNITVIVVDVFQDR